ncbi:MAG: thioredoxin fold domain-containing protein [Steroidobacteraceae bacterium]
MSKSIAVGTVCVLLTIAATCGSGRAMAAAPRTTSHADAPGIDWFAGDVGAAFESAKSANKPVFLYWGAKWCPPCQQLKSSVFSRSDFVSKTRQFVAVYLDGDDPGAQKWGEKFRVLSYPTVVVLRADQREVTRISGGMDLSMYTDLLDAALGDVAPMSDVLAALAEKPAGLSTAQCQRLAYYAWDAGDISPADKASVAAGLAQIAGSCVGLSPSERARITVISAALAPTPQTVAAVLGIIANPQIGPRVADPLEDLGDTFFAAVQTRGAADAAKFQRDWWRVMDAVANDPKIIDADQLRALGKKLELAKQYSADQTVPADLAAQARERVSVVLQKKMDPYVRAGVVNSASFVDEQLGDDAAEYAMLKAELATAKTPFYYMVDLGDIEEKRGRKTAALAWFARAYRESRGIATRFQWGSSYLDALLRLAPKDRARIRRVGLELIGELDGPDRIQARTRRRLEILDEHLRQWSAAQHAAADIRVLHSRMSTVCADLPSQDSGLASCLRFLQSAV